MKNSLSLLRDIFHEIRHKKATRNDFESHGYNAFVWVILSMTVAMQFWSEFHIWAAAGFIGGLLGVFARELIIDRDRGFDPLDIVSGMLATMLALMTVAGIVGALCLQ